MTNFIESDLIPFALKIIKNKPQGIETKDLLLELRELMKPDGQDLEMLNGRNDDKFSQKVRNLKSHNTLEKKGFVKFLDNRFYITDKGIEYLENELNKKDYKKLSINIQSDWPLSVRTLNCLKNENIIFVGDLLNVDRYDLLRLPNFGKKSWQELENLMHEHNIKKDELSFNANNWENLRRKLYFELKQNKTAKRQVNDNSGIKKLFKDFDRFASEVLNKEKIIITKDTSINEIEKLIINDIEEILSMLTEKMMIIFKGRFGYKEDFKTLDQIGKQFQITRERVRQIESKMNKSLGVLGKIEKNSLIDYFNKYEFISFHKLFPKLDEYFTDTASGTGEITGDRLTNFMEYFCNVEQEYFKTPERELWHFDKEKLREIFISTPSGINKENFIERIMESYGYNNFVATSTLDFMIKNNLIKFENDQIYPIDLNKNQEVANILLGYPDGLHWRKIAEIGNKSFTKNKWDLDRIVGDSSLNMLANEHIFLCERGTLKLFGYCKELVNKDKIIEIFLKYLKENNKEQMPMELAFKEIIKNKEFINLNFYDARAILKKFGSEKGIFHDGHSGTNTISLKKNIKTTPLKEKVLEIINNTPGEVYYKDINNQLQKTDEQVPIHLHLNDLVNQMKIFRVSPGTYVNFSEGINLCDKNEVKLLLDEELDNFEFITSGYMREKINNSLGFNLSNFYYDTLSRILAKENNWFYGTNYLSKKSLKKIGVDKYIKDFYESDLSINENFEKIKKIIGISKQYFSNIVYQEKLNFNTDWIHQND